MAAKGHWKLLPTSLKVSVPGIGIEERQALLMSPECRACFFCYVAFTELRNCAYPPRVTLRTQMYYYSYQWLRPGDLWHHPQATYFGGSKTVRPESLRTGRTDPELYMTGWHCSSCFRYTLHPGSYFTTCELRRGRFPQSIRNRLNVLREIL